MQTHTTTALAVLAAFLSGTAAAAAANATGPEPLSLAGWGYATFYNDFACTQNPGQAVSIGNAGCVSNEEDRHSIYIQPGENLNIRGQTASLVWSPGTSCNCQNECKTISYNGGNDYCMSLKGDALAQSFRFITQGCAKNNC